MDMYCTKIRGAVLELHQGKWKDFVEDFLTIKTNIKLPTVFCQGSLQLIRHFVILSTEGCNLVQLLSRRYTHSLNAIHKSILFSFGKLVHLVHNGFERSNILN